MSHLALRRHALPGSVLLLLAFVYLIAWAAGPDGTSAASGSAVAPTMPVTAVTRDCPPPAPGAGPAHVAFLAVPPPSSPSSPSSPASASASASSASSASAAKASKAAKAPGATTLTAIPAVGGGTATGTAPGPAAPGVLGFLSPPQASQDPATQVTGTGGVAQGFAAQQADADGTSTVTCTHPDSDEWFVGTGTQAGGSTSQLYLTNTGAMAASVEVTLLTDAGVQSGQDNEVTVPAHRYLSLNLAPQAGGSTVLAVHVQTSAGQVAADVWQDGGSGGAWLPTTESPATQLVIPGVTTQGGTAKLLVAVPGGQDAQLRVTALTSGGKAEPLGTAPQDAPAGASSSFTLNSLGTSAAALVVSSSVPVAAEVQVPGKGIGAFTAATAPLTGQGVVAGNPSGGGTAGLALSAPVAPVRVAITVLPPSHPERAFLPPQRTLTVQSGRTAEVAISPPKGATGPFAIVVTPQPGSGPLYAARMVMTSGNGLAGTLRSLLAVPSAPSVVQLPSATDTYTALPP